MNQSEMLARFAEAVPVDCFLLAGRYTLLDQGALDALFPVCAREEHRHPARRHLQQRHSRQSARRREVQLSRTPTRRSWRARVELDELCRKHGTELKAAALQFCMAHPAVTVAVMGARNAAEVADNIAMSERTVPQAFWQELRARKPRRRTGAAARRSVRHGHRRPSAFLGSRARGLSLDGGI